MKTSIKSPFVMCVDNEGYDASLELRKVYRVVRDPVAESHGELRVVDESGEDYVYPQDSFVAVALTRPAARLFAGAHAG